MMNEVIIDVAKNVAADLEDMASLIGVSVEGLALFFLAREVYNT